VFFFFFPFRQTLAPALTLALHALSYQAPQEGAAVVAKGGRAIRLHLEPMGDVDVEALLQHLILPSHRLLLRLDAGTFGNNKLMAALVQGHLAVCVGWGGGVGLRRREGKREGGGSIWGAAQRQGKLTHAFIALFAKAPHEARAVLRGEAGVGIKGGQEKHVLKWQTRDWAEG
jgi:hypothetical protein